MRVNKNNYYISPEYYLVSQRVSVVKYEYCNGYIHAIASASNPHILISLNLTT
ncbi:MAG: hypothetical protein WBA13_15420 [Microcoleaceae cyanobacterium]